MVNNQIVKGYVVSGKQLGRKLGFPTANILVDDINGIKIGVWVVRVTIDENIHYGVANIGYRPTVDNDQRSILEVSIFDFNEDLYGRFISVELLRYIRAEIKFDSVQLLKQAIDQDIAFAKAEVAKYQ